MYIPRIGLLRGVTGILAMAVACVCQAQTQRAWVPTSGVGDWFDSSNWNPSENYPQAGEQVLIANANASVLLTNSTYSLSALVVSNHATLVFSNWNTCLSATNVTVGLNGTITCAGPFTDSVMSNRVYIVTTNLLVAAGGSINVKGFAGGGAGQDGSGEGSGKKSSINNYSSGAGHGGPGGGGYTAGTAGSAYDSQTVPVLPGSGAGGGAGAGSGGHGGGAVCVQAPGGTITVNGSITANGGNGDTTYNNGGGSGGSIYLQSQTFDGVNGVVTANGGYSANGTRGGGGGGGGRVAIVGAPAAGFSRTVQLGARCGLGGYPGYAWYGSAGYPGTVYLSEAGLLPAVWSEGSGGVFSFANPSSWVMASLTVADARVDVDLEGNAVVVTNGLTVSSVNTWGNASVGSGWIGRFPDGLFLTNVTSLSVGGGLTVSGAHASLAGSAHAGWAGTNRWTLSLAACRTLRSAQIPTRC